MKRLLTALLVVVGLSACGATHHATSHATAAEKQQANQATAAVDSALKRCLPNKDGAPNAFVLRSHAGRQRFLQCAVPPTRRAAFDACLTKVALGGLPTKARLKSGAETCLARVEKS